MVLEENKIWREVKYNFLMIANSEVKIILFLEENSPFYINTLQSIWF